MAVHDPGRPKLVRVVHLITDLDVGGAERMLAKLVQATDSRRVRHTVVCMLKPGKMADDIRAAGCDVVSLNMKRGGISPRPLLLLVRLLRRERPDILQTWLYHADLLGTLAGRLAGVPAIVWNIRCSNMDLSQYARSTAFVVSCLARLSRLPASVIVNSYAGRDFHEQLGFRPKRWEVIHNGFDLEVFRPLPKARAELRQELKLPPDATLIGMLARLDPMKDHTTFLRAAAGFSRDQPNAHFILAGRGLLPESVALPAAARDPALAGRLHLLGEREDSARILAALDLATLSSAFGEGCPNVVGEAMACGVPCVATSVGDAAVLIGDTGAIVPPQDPDALAAAWRGLLDKASAERTALSAAARARIAEHFSLPIIQERYMSLYEQLSNKNA